MAEAALHTATTCKIRHVHIECPICLTRFIDPKILDCQHSFCLKCLQELVDKQDSKTDFILCPVCREKTSIPAKGPSALLNCFLLSSLIDDVINPNSPEKKTCSPKCRKHTDQELCFYCETCDLLVCLKCVVFDHRAQNHKLTEIKDSIRTYRQAVEEALMRFDECRKQFQKVDDSIKHSQHRLQLMVDRALQDIVAKEEEEVEKIRKASRLLQERVTQISIERGGEFGSKQSINSDKMSRAEQIVASVNDLMQHADDFELLDLKLKVMHNLTFHNELKFQTVQHSKSFIWFKGHDVVTDADIGEILEEEKWEVKTEFGKEGEGEGEFKFTWDVACLSNDDIVVTDSERQILSTFTSNGSYKSQGVQSRTEDGQLKKPIGVAVTSDDLLLVTDGQDVKVYDRELRYIRKFRPSQNQVEGQSESLLVGIAVDKKDRIAVYDFGRKVISLHNKDGSTISTIHHDDIGDTDNPSFISVNNKEQLIFTNLLESKLVCVDFIGNEVFNISTSLDGKTVFSTGVCCDDAGDIYACIVRKNGGGDGDRDGDGDGDGDGFFELHHYDASGEHIGCLARGLYGPLGMTFTPTGDLIVAALHSVKILHRV
ncbi:uncharacterized protein [Asterias amurensis]|uniref:uncharacterized protein n=1 Tax=Asterias amurensis TaxID=7602 RepID=UPI003AB915A8